MVAEKHLAESPVGEEKAVGFGAESRAAGVQEVENLPEEVHPAGEEQAADRCLAAQGEPAAGRAAHKGAGCYMVVDPSFTPLKNILII